MSQLKFSNCVCNQTWSKVPEFAFALFSFAFAFFFLIPDRACAFFMAGFHIYCIFHCSQKNGWIQTVCVQNSSDKTLKPLLWKILSLFHLCESKTANISFSKTVVHFVQPCFPFYFGSCSLKRQYNHCSSQASCFHKVMYI